MREQADTVTTRTVHRWRIGLIALVALLVTALITPLALAAPNAQDDGPTVLRIGYLGDPEGDLGNGAHLAIDQINEAGGFAGADGTTYLFELVTLPDAATAGSLMSDIDKLTQRSNLVALLGPETDDVLTPDNINDVIELGLPLLTPDTSDNLTEDDDSDWIFRIRAPEYVYSAALVTTMLDELAVESFALVQTDVDSIVALASFEAALDAEGIVPVEKIQQPDNERLDERAEQLASLAPDAVVMWGPMEDAASLLRQLRDTGWEGRFAYRQADSAARADVLPRELADGVLGVNNWVYSYASRASQIFLRDYSLAFNELPSGLAVAGYDAIWYLRTTVINSGASPDEIRDGLRNGTPVALVQGPFHPAEFANGDLVRVATVYELGQYGGPNVLARFDDREELLLDETGEDVVNIPTPTPGPPTSTPLPSATLEGVWAEVTATVLNVRSGPNFNYERIAQVNDGDVLRVVGTIADYTWLLVEFNGRTGWVKTEFVSLSGDIAAIQIVPIPATPTPGATSTAAVPAEADIVIDSVVLNPAQPVPLQPFTATVAVRNAGGAAAGQFAVAATFQPGSVYTASFVDGLAAGETRQVQLTATLPGSGLAQVAVVADLNNTVQEFNEDNNSYNITYRADYPLLTQQSNIQVNAGSNVNLDAQGVDDLNWDGSTLSAINGAQLGLLGGVAYQDVHYDQLSASVVNSASLDSSQVNAGVVLGVYTAEGRRAVVRIDNRSGNTIWISYRAYNN